VSVVSVCLCVSMCVCVCLYEWPGLGHLVCDDFLCICRSVKEEFSSYQNRRERETGGLVDLCGACCVCAGKLDREREREVE
jgi:hypothetical protein